MSHTGAAALTSLIAISSVLACSVYTPDLLDSAQPISASGGENMNPVEPDTLSAEPDSTQSMGGTGSQSEPSTNPGDGGSGGSGNSTSQSNGSTGNANATGTTGLMEPEPEFPDAGDGGTSVSEPEVAAPAPDASQPPMMMSDAGVEMQPVQEPAVEVMGPMIPDYVIDDMEGSDVNIAGRQGRRGAWFVAGPTNSDGTFDPTSPKPVARVPATTDNEQAIHMLASGFDPTQAGVYAVLGVNFNVVDLADNTTRPDAYEPAAEYVGIRFSAKTDVPGTLVKLQFPTVSTSYAHGGDDGHYELELATLTEEWQTFQVSWSNTALAQPEYASDVAFDPAELVGFYIAMAEGESGFDIWLDELEFVPPDATPAQ